MSEDNVRQAMEALTLGEKRDGERRVRFEEMAPWSGSHGTVRGGQSGCGQAMVEARERVRVSKAEAEAEKAEEWEVIEQEEEEEEGSTDEESTDDESSDDEEWVLESDGMVVAEVVEFV
ncbi:hypothetical protein LTR91_011984 [Friedmanniomyces endolithicus]|uniref:Uncharacterized protein n=1 Tax=Friedmanniomyces endolithicus TaxID=329885 RepID=A0AAN6QRC0_9PEZI|nr:hypothetical protein LTR94_006568 [Friedmanniomyces endolithicus]KAK0795176.1 hypothetical protein LTR59_007571 [Friedmanniomyces endolithicus]KAK0799994.1 hypothetical protein LTR75_009030 [Friedmanniomyces endolithicus]KAK0802054.1 hypothetical protein LTR38_006629 [Friedmanniomyces endolithicus]KAK0853694.1 hypothetical protein LTR03_002656 [Friedmanniomyces endolithicus]